MLAPAAGRSFASMAQVVLSAIGRDRPGLVGDFTKFMVERGVSIAAMDRRGVGYAVATELSEDEGAEIVASLH